MINTATSFLALLQEDDLQMKSLALDKLDLLVDQHWPEISDYIRLFKDYYEKNFRFCVFRKFLSGRKPPFSGEQKGLQLFSETIFAFSPTAAAVANTEFWAAPIIPVVFFPGYFF